uniref:Uncharacterized protein n=1 Tax=Arundo donax TaxID=35708 RepID=A0A0A9CZ14_ARUDO
MRRHSSQENISLPLGHGYGAAASLANMSFKTDGQLLLRCSRLIFATSLKFFGSSRNCKHASLSPWQWCSPANASIIATVLAFTNSHSLSSQTSLSLSILYLFAAATRSGSIAAVSPFISGNESVYM